MVRLRLKHKKSEKDAFLSLPEAEPVTLHEISSSNLPYACQCPLCGGIFEIPSGVLYEIVKDDYEDKESDMVASEERPKPPSNGGNNGFFDDFSSDTEMEEGGLDDSTL